MGRTPTFTPVINFNHPLADGLIFSLPFSEGGGVAPKEGVSKVLGSFGGSPTWRKELMGRCLQFSGASDKVNYTVPLSLSNAVTSKMSFMCWVYKTTNDVTGSRMIDPNGSASQGFLIQCPNNDFNVGVNHSTTSGSAVLTGGVPLNTWTQFGFTWDTKDNFPSLFKNGVSVAASTTTNKSGTQAAWAGVTALFGNRAGNDRVLGGYMALILMWNRVLNQNEFKQLYTNPWLIYNNPKSIL